MSHKKNARLIWVKISIDLTVFESGTCIHYVTAINDLRNSTCSVSVCILYMYIHVLPISLCTYRVASCETVVMQNVVLAFAALM